MKELSIFIDESGDFGETQDFNAYYLVTFVFHNICSFDLLKIKREEGRLSKGEKQFFYKPNELKKHFLRV